MSVMVLTQLKRLSKREVLMVSMDHLLRTSSVINSSLLQLRSQQEPSKASVVYTCIVYCYNVHEAALTFDQQ